MARAHARVAGLVAAVALQLRGDAAGGRRPLPVRRARRAPRGGLRPGGDRRRAHRDREAHDPRHRQRDRRLVARSSTRSAAAPTRASGASRSRSPPAGGDRRAAERRLQVALSVLAEAGVDASGLVVDGDPFDAARGGAWTRRTSTRSCSPPTRPGRSGWMDDDVVDRLRKATGLGVTRVVVRPDEAREPLARPGVDPHRRDRRRRARQRRAWSRRCASAPTASRSRRRPALPDGARRPGLDRRGRGAPLGRVRARARGDRRASRRPASRRAARCSTATPPRPPASRATRTAPRPSWSWRPGAGRLDSDEAVQRVERRRRPGPGGADRRRGPDRPRRRVASRGHRRAQRHRHPAGGAAALARRRRSAPASWRWSSSSAPR